VYIDYHTHRHLRCRAHVHGRHALHRSNLQTWMNQVVENVGVRHGHADSKLLDAMPHGGGRSTWFIDWSLLTCVAIYEVKLFVEMSSRGEMQSCEMNEER
jgi:hypothetical protein